MNQNKQYLSICKNCQQKQPHYVYRVNKLRGVRLMCSKCGSIQKRYSKLNLLHEYSVTKSEEGGDNETNKSSG